MGTRSVMEPLGEQKNYVKISPLAGQVAPKEMLIDVSWHERG